MGPKDVRVPRTNIIDARQEPPPQPIFRIGLRNYGLWVPNHLIIGSFKIRGRRIFYDLRQRHVENVIRVDLRDEEFDCLYVEVEDPAAALALLGEGRA